jgi:chemotaxis response regulator CheB
LATTDGSGRVHTVAIGASAGGIEALRSLVAQRATSNGMRERRPAFST